MTIALDLGRKATKQTNKIDGSMHMHRSLSVFTACILSMNVDEGADGNLDRFLCWICQDGLLLETHSSIL